jgi:GH25 family lysozyme M1 (1,4-beta-N-acetylmuramidase)
MGHIFVSYSRADQKDVDDIIQQIEIQGFDLWFDRGDIVGGETWRRKIVEAIEAAEAFLLILSRNSVVSDNVRREVDLAQGAKIPILPVMLERDINIPPDLKYQLVGIQRIDITTDEGTQLLIEALSSVQEPRPLPGGILSAEPKRSLLSDKKTRLGLAIILVGTVSLLIVIIVLNTVGWLEQPTSSDDVSGLTSPEPAEATPLRITAPSTEEPRTAAMETPAVESSPASTEDLPVSSCDDGVLSLADRALGMDVSAEQEENVDFQKATDAGISFAIIRAGSGSSEKDENFEYNYAEAGKAGLLRGIYYVLYPESEATVGDVEDRTPEGQARRFASQLKGDAELGAFLDATYSGLTPEDVRRFVDEFQIADPTSRPIAIRAGFWSWNASRGFSGSAVEWAADHPLWVVHLILSSKPDAPSEDFKVVIPEPWQDYVIHQWTEGGGLSACQDREDLHLNVFDGSFDELERWARTSEDSAVSCVGEVPAAPDRVLGMDVSRYQGENIDFQKAAESGVKFAIVRVGGGVLGLEKDTGFEHNYTEAGKAGMLRGIYWTLIPNSPDVSIRTDHTPEDQARFYVLQLADDAELGAFLDVSLRGLTPEEVKRFVDEFQKLDPYDRPITIGTAAYLWNESKGFSNSAVEWAAEHPLWVMHLLNTTDPDVLSQDLEATVPEPWQAYTFHLWTADGGSFVCQQRQSLDLDFFNGSSDELEQWARTTED